MTFSYSNFNKSLRILNYKSSFNGLLFQSPYDPHGNSLFNSKVNMQSMCNSTSELNECQNYVENNKKKLYYLYECYKIMTIPCAAYTYKMREISTMKSLFVCLSFLVVDDNFPIEMFMQLQKKNKHTNE